MVLRRCYWKGFGTLRQSADAVSFFPHPRPLSRARARGASSVHDGYSTNAANLPSRTR